MKAEVVTFFLAAGIGGLGSHLTSRDNSLPEISAPVVIQQAENQSIPPAVEQARTFTEAAEFYDWLGSASATELEQMLTGLFQEQMEFGSAKWQQVDTILRRLASVAPERALDLINQHWIDRHGSLRDKRRIVIGIWARTDVVAAVKGALAIDPEGELLPLFNPLPTEKAEELYELMIEQGLDRSPYIGNLLNFMARDEEFPPALAAERVLAGKQNRWGSRDYALESALGRWHREDPAAVKKWLDTLENPGTKERANLALAQTLFQTDGLKGLDVLWPQLTQQGKQQFFQDFGLGQAVQEKGIDQVLDWLDNNVKSPTAYSAAIASIARSGLSKSPEAIGEIIDRAGEPTPQLTQAVQAAVKSWAGKDPDAANAFITSLTDPKMRNAAIAGVVQQKIWSDPAEAVRLFGELDLSAGPDSVPELQNIAPHLAISLGQRGMELDEILQLYPESMRGETAASYAQAFATQAPEKVLAWIEKTPLDYDYRYTFDTALHTWLAKDSAAAMNWFTGLEEGPHRKLAVETVVQAYANQAPDSAIHWLESLPPGKSKDAGALKLAQFIAANDPERGLEFALTVSDDRKRNEILEQALSTIANQNPEEALRLLGDLKISGKAHQNITRQIKELNSLRDSLLLEGH